MMMRLISEVRRRGAVLLAAGGAAILSASCSVKEDREPCPCYLNVSLAEGQDLPDSTEVKLLGWNDAELFRAGVDVSRFDPYWVRGVRKGVLTLAAWRGAGKAKDVGHHVTVAPGDQADSLYAFHQEVDCTGDMAYAEVVFRKQFCTVHLDILRRASEMQDFRFLVEGNTCGFDLLNFEPVPGSFRCEPVPEAGARVVDFRIPRQVDESMTVTLWYRNADGGYENLGTFPLGEYIARTGYNWAAEELQDVYIVIDLVFGQVTISVDGWEDGWTFTYIEQ